MSLVLNTNKEGSFQINNSEFNRYYDFDQLLLQPDFGIVYGKTIETSPEAYSVNGTKVNYIFGVLENPSCFLSSGLFSYGGLNMRNNNNSLTVRCGTGRTLPAGKTIGKEVRLKLVQSDSNSYTKGYEIKLGLLHSDGTITYFVTLSGTTAPNILEINKYFSGNGVVSLAGDHIIADINLYNTTYASNQTTYWGFGFPGTTMACPIQVSIE